MNLPLSFGRGRHYCAARVAPGEGSSPLKLKCTPNNPTDRDFINLWHNMVNSYQSFLFSASIEWNNQFNQGIAQLLLSFDTLPQ
jgi:hypothetical protein